MGCLDHQSYENLPFGPILGNSCLDEMPDVLRIPVPGARMSSEKITTGCLEYIGDEIQPTVMWGLLLSNIVRNPIEQLGFDGSKR